MTKEVLFSFSCPRCGQFTPYLPLNVEHHPICGACKQEGETIPMIGTALNRESCCAWHHSNPDSILGCMNS